MTAGDLMTRKFETVQADAYVEEVARKLESCDVGVLPVCRDGLLVGMVAHGDLVGRTASRRAEPLRVADLLPPDVLFCFENTEVTEAVSLMKENRIALLPVLGRNKNVVGVLALKDIPEERPRRKSG